MGNPSGLLGRDGRLRLEASPSVRVSTSASGPAALVRFAIEVLDSATTECVLAASGSDGCCC